jgi:hypothetical protein
MQISTHPGPPFLSNPVPDSTDVTSDRPRPAAEGSPRHPTGGLRRRTMLPASGTPGGSGRHRAAGAGRPARAWARLDRSGSCRAPGSDPTRWAVPVPERGLNERARARVRARVLCSSCPVQRLCRRTVLAVLAVLAVLTVRTQSSPRSGDTAAAQGVWAHGVWGGLAAWEVRALVRRSRKRRALARVAHLTPSRAAA